MDKLSPPQDENYNDKMEMIRVQKAIRNQRVIDLIAVCQMVEESLKGIPSIIDQIKKSNEYMENELGDNNLIL